jgi:hypothetical protein
MDSMKRYLLAGFLLCLLLGCAGYTGEPTPDVLATQAAMNTRVAMTKTAAPTATVGLATQTTMPVGTAVPLPTGSLLPGEMEGCGLEGLLAPENLDSFRLTEEFSWEGTASDGSELSEQMAATVELVREPPALWASLKSNAEEMSTTLGIMGLGGDTLEIYMVEGSLYMSLFGGWIQMSPEAAGAEFEPAGAFLDQGGTGFTSAYTMCQWIDQGEYVSLETYKGIVARHYRFDETSFDLEALPRGMEIEAASGDLHVAAEGDYIVHLDLVVEGTNLAGPDEAQGPMLQQGTLTYRSDLSAINEPLAIVLPAEVVQATSLPDEIPIPEGAKTLMAGEMLGMRIFLLMTDRMPSGVADFYRGAMPERGWTVNRASVSAGTHSFEFTKDDRIAMVQVSTDPRSGKTLVAILPRGVSDPAFPLDLGNLFPSELFGP